MRRRTVLAGAAAAVGLAGCTSAAEPGNPTSTTGEPTTTDPDKSDSEQLVNPSFEQDWTGWTVGRDLPGDPNREGDRDVASSLGVTTEASTDGQTCLKLAIDGSQDDGTVWVQQAVDLSGYESLSVDVTVSTSFNHIRNAAVYAGPTPDQPLTETDFDVSQSLEGHDSDGWKTFTYSVDHDGVGLVAVGFSVVWETETSAMIDNVRLSESPPDST